MPASKSTRRDAPTHVQAIDSASGDLNGEPWVIRRGEIFDATHELVRKYPQHFQPVRATRPTVEAATAFPGEQRGSTPAEA